jgi:hypothetical protein
MGEELGEQLGGTYGAVSRGRCLQSGREVALSRLPLEPPKVNPTTAYP